MQRHFHFLKLYGWFPGFETAFDILTFPGSYQCISLSSTSLKSVNTHNSKEVGIGVYIHSKIEMDRIILYRETIALLQFEDVLVES